MEYEQIHSKHDLCQLLNIQTRQLTGLLYYTKIETCYRQFTIPKKNGDVRTINAPVGSLKFVQRKLSRLLLKRLDEISEQNNIKQEIAHAFFKGRSIKTNALPHRNKKYLLNVDLKDFFDTIHFGRVQGFFKKNKYFKLPDEIATIIAQLTCYNGKLPQGAPTSPVISNLICQILDNKILQLCKKYRLTYTRYADDLTFSTNKKEFIEEYGNFLEELDVIIEASGFSINSEKTRFQNNDHRQVVTGLSVNKKVNVKKEFYKNTRSMAYSLYTTGSFTIDDQPGTLSKLEGRFSFINDLVKYNRLTNEVSSKTSNTFEYQKNLLTPKKFTFEFDKISNTKKLNTKESLENLTIREKDYQKFLFYKYFLANDKILIIPEGKTDSRYIKAALKRYHDRFPNLITKVGSTFRYHFRFLPYTNRFRYFFKYLDGGGNDLISLLHFFIDINNQVSRNYISYFKNILHQEPLKPVVFLLDNEENRKKPLKNFINSISKGTNVPFDEMYNIIRSDFLYNIDYNSFLLTLPTPYSFLLTLSILSSQSQNQATEINFEIEDLFDLDFINENLIAPKFGGRKFDKKKKHEDHQHISKEIFSKEILNNYNSDYIDFSNFIPLLEKLNELSSDYTRFKR